MNHVHVEREIVSWRARGNLVGQGVVFAAALAQALGVAHPEHAFDVWAIFSGDGCVVRFHQRHDDDPGWELALDEHVPWRGVHVG